MQSEELIQTLTDQTHQILNQVEKMKSYDLKTLTWKEHEQSWCMLECLEHLNRYGHFYLPQLVDKIRNSTTPAEKNFKPGILGNYFAQSMLPKDKLNKMKTFKDKNPLYVNLNKTVIEECINQQNQLLALLNQSRKVSLNKVKIPTSISSFIKLKLGDTLRFVINHNIRHLQQIDRVHQAMKV